MKVTRRSGATKGGHLLVSVPARRIDEVDAALAFLKQQRKKRGSQIILDLIVNAAKRNGWKPTLHEGAADGSRSNELGS